MRLKKVERGHPPPWKILIEKILPARGERDIVKLMRYRPELFGKYYLAALHGMTGWSELGEGRTHLLAAFVSRLNRCAY